ncbi:hypothetical protein HYH02_013684 [Chlamydomonas schloesseri]|uniref:Mitochondrial ribosomal protein L29 n=1 Tax=Chlamydomonas schloesseri TaxID=2026947 RepID=A0A835SP14_9CHLO|nr:hypothetical protein HYH02_013684 [Chlamydomonas schloesseri]|eukprot:KAG2430687.1 hypothetical protein HYH02_013684 [Chlamydomonas schloesseri]
MQVARAFTAVRPARSVAAPAQQRVSVVAMAKPTKLADFAGLSNEELVNKSNLLKRELAQTKWLQRTRGVGELKPGENQPQPDPEKVPKGHLNKHIRRQIAQCLTLLRQRQVAEGVDRKEARRIEKRAALANGTM